MTQNNWSLQPEAIFALSPIIPVMVINKIEQAVPLAKALVAGGISVLEVTLRTSCALDAIKKNCGRSAGSGGRCWYNSQ